MKDDPDPGIMPPVSIIVPCYNEERTISLLLQAIYEQTYPLQLIEVIIADGLSTDATEKKIKEFIDEHQGLTIRIVQNPKRNIPAGLNLALVESKGDIVIRLDAHSKPDPNYIIRSVNALNLGLGDNVGGVWMIQPYKDGDREPTWIARGIAAAASHPIGAGDALYRYASSPGEVDTVPFGAFKRQLVEKVGYFNEELLTNEDYEFNYRIRLSGGKIWLDPEIRSVYFTRASIPALIKQYWRYGYWKAKMLRQYPGSIRWRQILPPVFVACLILFLVLSIFIQQMRIMFALQIGVYGIFLGTISLYLAINRKDPLLALSLPAAFTSMHISWGLAFLYSYLTKFATRPFKNT